MTTSYRTIRLEISPCGESASLPWLPQGVTRRFTSNSRAAIAANSVKASDRLLYIFSHAIRPLGRTGYSIILSFARVHSARSAASVAR
jgi:hypothetical protein